MTDQQRLLRSIPAVEVLLGGEQAAALIDTYGRVSVVEGIRSVLQELRQAVINSKIHEFTPSMIYELLAQWLAQQNQSQLRHVINATGVVLHTNLGRAPLAEEAISAIAEVARGYSNLEFILESGERGSRYNLVEGLLTELTGAEGAIVVNNNAAAVMLVLGTMAAQKEVVISRGQLVEIGGSFRVPDVMKQSGAYLVEVGTTNKTHRKDYQAAITQDTALLLRVHTSNFRMIGFTAEVSVTDLVDIGYQYSIPVYEDQGSGMLARFAGIPETEMTVSDSIAAGVDIVSFSGDKLLGGPQAGIIVGKSKYIEKMKRNPLLRAFRIDKLSLAALEATLRLHKQGQDGTAKLPVARMLTMQPAELRQRAVRLAELLRNTLPLCDIDVQEIDGYAGGGALPGEALPSVAVTMIPQHIGLNQAAAQLRQANPPVICRVGDGKMFFDVRTMNDWDFPQVVEACKSTMG